MENKRAQKLEKAILEAIAKFNIKLKSEVYIELKNQDICGCAIGAAIMSTAKDNDQLNDILNRYNKLSVFDAGKVALEIVNDGITAEDLKDLEAGFEGWRSNTTQLGAYPNFEINLDSEFYKLGQRLAKKI